jgi:hypothetical protein
VQLCKVDAGRRLASPQTRVLSAIITLVRPSPTHRGHRPGSHYALDGILGNQTDLPVTGHAIDTHGATLANFARSTWSACNCRRGSGTWVRSPRTGQARGAASWPATRRRSAADPPANSELITAMRDDLLRVAASVMGGHATEGRLRS